MPEILAVLVLYKEDPRSCVALQSFLKSRLETVRDSIKLLVYDNGPEDQGHLLEDRTEFEYRHDHSNGMLWAAYSYGLKAAQASSCRWLMLLDQDTSITPEYMAEAVRVCGPKMVDVCAVTPRLLIQGEQQSPFFFKDLYRDFGERDRSVERVAGRCVQKLMAWNSGAIMRVDRVLAMGGFLKEFPLDNLDHAMFTRLQEAEDRIYVMASQLKHNLSVASMETMSPMRLRGKLASEIAFEADYLGIPRRHTAIRFFRTGGSLFIKLRNKWIGLMYIEFGLRCFARCSSITTLGR